MLTVRSLASGSSGNAFLVETDHVSLLLDAGLPAKRLRTYLADLRVDCSRLAGVVVTHEHGDHIRGAAAFARQLGIPVYATPGTLRSIEHRRCEMVPIAPERPLRIGDLTMTSFSVSHDAAEPVGVLVENCESSVALATDIGRVDERAFDWMSRADLLVLEANHDVGRLWNGPYPARLKRRIAGSSGHLSNEEAARCIVTTAERGRVRWAWLAHLSEVNNSQRAALGAARRLLDGGPVSVSVARRDEPSLVWRSSTAYLQERLF